MSYTIENQYESESESGVARPTDRDEIMNQLAALMEFVEERIEAEMKSNDPESGLLIKWVRAHGYLAGQYRKLMRDTDIDEMQDELELLQEAAENL